MATLFGNGKDTDTSAIQELLDSGRHEIHLPDPAVCYLIDKPLRIHSFQSLILPRYATVRLAGGSNCHMVENADMEDGNHDITVCGGIWDYNNLEQSPNPVHFPDRSELSPDDWPRLMIFCFEKVTHLTISDLTFKDPAIYACSLDTVSHFTVENIRFDFNRGKCRPVNMDGIHVNGNCHFGHIRNLHGACYDDLVALNADEGSDGPISHIDVRGIYAKECHSAVRLLTFKHPLTDVHISDIHGSFYQYCVGLTKFYHGETTGYFDGIVLENIFASKSPRHSYLTLNEEMAKKMFVFPLIWAESETVIRSLVIRNLRRKEEHVPISTICVEEGCTVENLCVENCSVENCTDGKVSLFDLAGEVKEKILNNNRITGGPLFDPDKNKPERRFYDND